MMMQKMTVKKGRDPALGDDDKGRLKLACGRQEESWLKLQG